MDLFKTKCLASLEVLDILDIKSDPEYLDCVIDLERVESFMSNEDHHGKEITLVKLHSGDELSIIQSFEEFEEIMDGAEQAIIQRRKGL